MLRTIVVVWICIAVFGNHDDHSSGASGGTSIEMGSGGSGPDMPADGHNPSALLPVETDVGAMPPGVQRFLVEVASESTQVTVTQSAQSGSFEQPTPGSWTGEVVPTAGYAAPVGPVGQQSERGPVSLRVSAIVTATASDSSSTVQCRIYAADVLVLVSTGPGTVTCRVPAVHDASG